MRLAKRWVVYTACCAGMSTAIRVGDVIVKRKDELGDVELVELSKVHEKSILLLFIGKTNNKQPHHEADRATPPMMRCPWCPYTFTGDNAIEEAA